MSSPDPASAALPEDREYDLLAPSPELLGDSASIRRVRELIVLAAAERAPVLVVAEAGLAGEAVAREIHARRGGPFVSLECATIEPSQPERELFGRAGRGSAGLEIEAIGPDSRLAAAMGGVLFLANVTELPAVTQRRLGRLLRDREVLLAGGPSVPLDVQVVAGAPPEVDDEVREGRFRGDLSRRLGGVRIELPALRDRRDDVRTIASWVARQVCAREGIVPKTFTQAALTLLAALPWRGNARELVELLERVVPEAPGSVVRLEDVLAQLRLDSSPAAVQVGGGLRTARRQFERTYIAAVLRHHGWRMSAAAKALGIQRANLYRKARQLGIPAGEGRRRT